MSEWDNVKKVSEPAGVGIFGYGPVLDVGEEVWFYGKDRQLYVGRDASLVGRPSESDLRPVEERWALFDERQTLYVEVERRGDALQVRRGLLNGRFHEAVADEPVDALIERYTRLGFKPGFGWNIRRKSTVLREFRDGKTKRTIRVDGSVVLVRDGNEGKRHELSTREEAITKAEALVAQWQTDGHRLVLVEGWGAENDNPSPRWEIEREARIEGKHREPAPEVSWEAPVSTFSLDIAAAAESAPPTLMDVEAELDELLEQDADEPLHERLEEMEGSVPANYVVFAEAIRRAGAASAAQHVVPGSWNPDEQAVVVVGDLEVQGDCSPETPVVVTGNLHVHGRLDQSCDTPMIVLGEVRAEHITTDGTFVIGGDCKVEGVLLGSHNDEVLEIHGDLHAGVWVTDEHMMVVAGETHLRHRPPSSGAWGEDTFDERDDDHVTALRALLGDDAFDASGEDFEWTLVPKDF